MNFIFFLLRWVTYIIGALLIYGLLVGVISMHQGWAGFITGVAFTITTLARRSIQETDPDELDELE